MAKRFDSDKRVRFSVFGNSRRPASTLELGAQPFNRDCILLAFDKRTKAALLDGQKLAGTGALVFEGELLTLPAEPFGMAH